MCRVGAHVRGQDGNAARCARPGRSRREEPRRAEDDDERRGNHAPSAQCWRRVRHGRSGSRTGGRWQGRGGRQSPTRGGDLVQAVHQIHGGLRAIRRALFQAAHDERAERGRNGVAATRDRLRRFRHVRGQQPLRRAARERRLSGEQLVREHAKGVDVRAVIHGRIGTRLFGRHVRRCAECHAHRRGVAALAVARRRDGLGDPEVGDHGAAAGQQHVVRLDVAVHDATIMRIRERRRDLAQQADRLAERQLAMPREPCAQRLAFHQRHGEVRQAVRVARREQWHDVRVLQSRRERDLSLEALQRHLADHVFRQHLHHHSATEGLLRRDEYTGHSAATELALQRVGVTQGQFQLCAKIHDAKSSRSVWSQGTGAAADGPESLKTHRTC